MDEGFPASLFRMGGSPAAIQTSTARYQRFGQAATQAADRIAGMDIGQFIGPEADQFRQKLNSDLPPHLRVTGQAFTQVSSALGAFASQLAELQAQMRPLADQAPGAWQRLQAAKAAFADAHAADQARNAAPPPANVDPSHPATSAPHPAAPASPGAQAQLNAAQQEWDALVHNATMLRGEMTAASRRCSQAIEAAKAMRFQKPPGRFDLLGQARDFLREHQDTLKSVANTLKSASAAVSALGLALQAIPGLGTALGSALLAAGVGMGATGFGIDLVVSLVGKDRDLTFLFVGRGLMVIAIARSAWGFLKQHSRDTQAVGDALSTTTAVLGAVAIATAPIEPVGAIFAAAAGITGAGALAAHGLAKATGANVSWTSVGFDAIGLVPFGKGFVTGSKVATMANDATPFASKFVQSAAEDTTASLHKGFGSSLEITKKEVTPLYEGKTINVPIIKTMRMIPQIGEDGTQLVLKGKGLANRMAAGANASFNQLRQGQTLGTKGLYDFFGVHVDPMSRLGRTLDSGIKGGSSVGSYVYHQFENHSHAPAPAPAPTPDQDCAAQIMQQRLAAHGVS